jgi:ferredoxin-NADP reductase
MDAAELDLVVREVRAEASGVVSLALADPDGADLPAWQPGAHLGLLLPMGARQYSLCGDPLDLTCYRVAVLLSPTTRGGSQHVHERLAVGAMVRTRAPRNHFALVEADDYLFVAGGIGITPLLPMVRAAEAAHASWRLVYGGRSLESMAFREPLAEFGPKVSLVPQDTDGLIDLDTLLATSTATEIYCCGPEPLLEAVEARATSRSGRRLHLERFTASQLDVADPTEAFEVVCQKSGLTVEVGRAQTMLDALLAAGIEVDSDCEEGICGTCELAVLSGRPDHRDDILTEEERQTLILPCVSRAFGTRIVVDA